MNQVEKEELDELRRLAAIGKQLEDNAAAAAEVTAKSKEAAAAHERSVAAVREAFRQERAEAAARFKRSLKSAAGAALAAGFIAGYAVLVGDAWSEMSAP